MWRATLILCVLLVNCTEVRAELPPEIMADRYLVQAEELYAEKEYAGAFKVMEKIVALQKTHNFKLPDEYHFRYAQLALSADSMQIALDSVNRYLVLAGRDGEFYKEALALSLKAESPEISAEETCAGKPYGVACWRELTSHPQCYVWDENYDEDWIATWSGNRYGSVAHGPGTLILADDRRKWKFSHTGRLEKGKSVGHWVERKDFGDNKGESKWKGEYVAGKREGRWLRFRPGGRPSGDRCLSAIFRNGDRETKWNDASDSTCDF